MNFDVSKCLARASVVVVLAVSAAPSSADPAMMLGPEICKNQRDSFDYFWLLANDPNTLLYFMDDAGTVHSVGHNTAFDSQRDVQVSIHGNIGSVGPFSGEAFANFFHKAHPTTPNSVTLNVCFGAAVPNAGISSMASLARAYPGALPDSTAINAVSAPLQSCSLRASDTNHPFMPIGNIAQAVYRSAVQNTPAHNVVLNALMNAWTDAVHTPYPNTHPAMSFQKYCKAQPFNNPDAWLESFLNAVNLQFAGQYLNLINTNYAGNPFVTCGVNVQCN